MPIYEYRCDTCGHELEAFQKVNDWVLQECPVCKKETLKRLISAPAFHLKGSGWYVTDFKEKPKQKENSTEPTKVTESKTETTGATPKKQEPTPTKIESSTSANT